MFELTTTNESYRKSIEIVVEILENEDWELAKDMVVELAKMDANTLISCYGKVKGENDALIIQALKEGEMIKAIKIRRSQTGDDLKTSKEYVEELKTSLKL